VGLAVVRFASGEAPVEGFRIVIDGSGVNSSRFLATKDGFAAVAMQVTEEGVTVADLAASAEGKVEEDSKQPSETQTIQRMKLS